MRARTPAAAADALGGNCLTLMVVTVRQGDWEASSTTLRQLAAARSAVCFPVINHARARGLLHKLRFRLLALTVSGWGPFRGEQRASDDSGVGCAVPATAWLRLLRCASRAIVSARCDYSVGQKSKGVFVERAQLFCCLQQP